MPPAKSPVRRADTCGICREPYTADDKGWRAFNCDSHYFHRACWDKWLEKTKGATSCPLCREPVLGLVARGTRAYTLHNYTAPTDELPLRDLMIASLLFVTIGISFALNGIFVIYAVFFLSGTNILRNSFISAWSRWAQWLLRVFICGGASYAGQKAMMWVVRRWVAQRIFALGGEQ